MSKKQVKDIIDAIDPAKERCFCCHSWLYPKDLRTIEGVVVENNERFIVKVCKNSCKYDKLNKKERMEAQERLKHTGKTVRTLQEWEKKNHRYETD